MHSCDPVMNCLSCLVNCKCKTQASTTAHICNSKNFVGRSTSFGTFHVRLVSLSSLISSRTFGACNPCLEKNCDCIFASGIFFHYSPCYPHSPPFIYPHLISCPCISLCMQESRNIILPQKTGHLSLFGSPSNNPFWTFYFNQWS